MPFKACRPFNPTNTIHYPSPKATKTRLEIYNLRGQRVATLVDHKQAAGYYAVIWDGKDDFGNQVTSGACLFWLNCKKIVKLLKFFYCCNEED